MRVTCHDVLNLSLSFAADAQVGKSDALLERAAAKAARQTKVEGVHGRRQRNAALDRRRGRATVDIGTQIAAVGTIDPDGNAGIGPGRCGGITVSAACIASGVNFDALMVRERCGRFLEFVSRRVAAAVA